jgi:hypothetical protein
VSDFSIETWAEFRDHTPPAVPYLVDGVVPVGAVGMLGAGAKCGKSWLALHMAVCLASGRPFLGRFVVPEARPVVYVALEGMRANLRARIGVLSRGAALDPDGADLELLHLLYKPRAQVDLRDAESTHELLAEMLALGPALAVFDVLRKAATVRESNEGVSDFRQVLANIQPLLDAGSAVLFPHHNAKVTSESEKRDAGERMSGSGSLYGSADFGMFITRYDRASRMMVVELVSRDEADLGKLTVRLVGQGSSQHGGFTYHDRCVVTATSEHDADEQRAEDQEQAIADYLADHGGASQTKIVEAVGGNAQDARRTLQRMINRGTVFKDDNGPRGSFRHWLENDPTRPRPMDWTGSDGVGSPVPSATTTSDHSRREWEGGRGGEHRVQPEDEVVVRGLA